MAFDIRPPSAPASSKSGSPKSGPAGGPVDPNTPIFSTQLAKTPSRRAVTTAQQTRPTTAQPPKRAAEPAKSADPSAQPVSRPAKPAKRPASQTPSAKQSSDTDTSHDTVGQNDGSAARDATATKDNTTPNDTAPPSSAAAENPFEANAAAGIGGSAPRAVPGRNGSADSQAPASVSAEQADPSKLSGLSLLQLLARSLGNSANETPPAAVASSEAGSSAPTGEPTTKPSSADTDGSPNALTLAMLLQALAGALGTPVPASGESASAGLGTASNHGEASGALESATSAGGSSSSVALQGLISLLARELGADASDKKGPLPTDTATANSPPANTNPVDGTSPRADSVVQSFAQLGLTSHFGRDPIQLQTQAPVGSPAWRDELSAQLTWMTHRGLESGSLRVSPEHLGPVEVQISVNNGDASVWFGAAHPDTRAALEQALPRLREMFATQGLTLTDSGVSREAPRNQTRHAAAQSVAAVSAAVGSEPNTTPVSALGLVDTYV